MKNCPLLIFFAAFAGAFTRPVYGDTLTMPYPGPLKLSGDIYDLIGNLYNNATDRANDIDTCGESGRSRREIADTILKYIPAVNVAYKERTKINSQLAGRLLVQMQIISNGSVKNASVISQSTNDEMFNNQILAIIKKMHFSESKPCDTLSVIQYPFIFGNTNSEKGNERGKK